MDLRETYNRIAEDWNKENGGWTWSTPRVQAFATYFPKGSLILDAGCGPGNKARELMDVGMRVHGFDFSEEMVRLARQAVPEGTFNVGDLREVAVDSEYDGILALASLLHISKAEVGAVVGRLWEHLKPSGYFFVAVKEQKEGGPAEEVVARDDYGYPIERFFSFFTMEELKKYFTDLGGEVVMQERFPIGRTVWLNVIIKK